MTRVLLLSTSILLSGCASGPDRLDYTTVESKAEGRPMSYGVYTPPNWDQQTPLPLVVFLHGAGDDERVFDERKVVPRILDEWIADGRLPPFLMAVPDGQRGFWTNWHDGSHHYEDWVMNEVVPEMYARYPIREGRENLHLMGISMGGAGTLYIALHNRERFASAAVWSAPIFDVDQTMDFLEGKVFRSAPAQRMFGPPDRATVEKNNVYGQLRAPEDLAGMELLIGAGTRDIPGILPSTEKFQAHLENAGIPHRYVVYRGGHHWKDWARVFPVALCKHLKRDECELEADSFYTLEELD